MDKKGKAQFIPVHEMIKVTLLSSMLQPEIHNLVHAFSNKIFMNLNYCTLFENLSSAMKRWAIVGLLVR